MSNTEVAHTTSFKCLGKEKSHIFNSALLIEIERAIVVMEKLQSSTPVYLALLYIIASLSSRTVDSISKSRNIFSI